jgi:hypothetical protein
MGGSMVLVMFFNFRMYTGMHAENDQHPRKPQRHHLKYPIFLQKNLSKPKILILNIKRSRSKNKPKKIINFALILTSTYQMSINYEKISLIS